MNKIKFSFFLLLFFTVVSLFAQKITISGYVLDEESSEPVIGANLYNPVTLKGTTTNKFGFFSFSISPENKMVLVSCVGYTAVSLKVTSERDTVINFMLKPGRELEEVDVFGKIYQNVAVAPVSLSSKQVSLLPNLTGEADLMKAYQYLPGIAQGAEGDNSLYVRGGSPDQNLILLDDVPLYYINHIGGLVSVFDENAVANMSVYKGGFPARYGGRLSSVVDVTMKNGDMKKLGGEVAVGVISSKFFIEGPLLKNRASFMLTARKSLTDLYLRPISYFSTEKIGYLTYSFYDVNGKINYRLNDNNRIYASFYNGADNVISSFNFDSENDDLAVYSSKEYDDCTYDAHTKYGWGNTMGCLRWNHIYSKKLFSNATLAMTHYYYTNLSKNEITIVQTNVVSEAFKYDYDLGVTDKLLKLDYDYYPDNNHQVKFGGKLNLHRFNTGSLHQQYSINEEALIDSTELYRDYGEEIDTTYGSERVKAIETAVYIEDEMQLFDWLTANAGAHLVNYNYKNENYFSLQPRIAIRAGLGNGYSVNASFAQMRQFVHMLTGSDTSTPTDIWVPATSEAPPEKSIQYTLGIEKTILSKGYKVSVEGFYKKMDDLIDYKLGYSLVSSTEQWYDKIATGGRGTAYGIEFLLQKKTGKLTGWFGYTYSRNMRQFAEINNGAEYPYVYDRPHDLSLVLNYKLKKHITLSGVWEYRSGRRMTIGTAVYDANVVQTSQNLPAHDYSYYLCYNTNRHSFI
nr:TonB-dependent receptor [Prolixibacteraceae bacterium]